MNLPIRFAVIGARRGRTFINSAKSFPDRVQLVAVCDTNPDMLAEWSDENSIRCYNDYQHVLEDPNIDAVCLATPVPLHARQAIQAINAGKHVLSEVTATYDVEEGWELIRAVERTGLTYMMAENYCFMRDVLMVQNMVEQGVFGELTFAEGSYIHDCRSLYFYEDGELTWRGQVRRERGGNTYPTHSLGPVCRWLGINRTDKLKTTATWHSRARAIPHYAKRNFPAHADYANADYWPHSDTVTSMIRTQNEVLIESRIDWASARPHHMTRYGLQGTTAAFASQADPHLDPLIWIEGRSPMKNDGTATEWESLWKYADEFEHPLWREHLKDAQAAGHGGGDFFVLREFANAVIEDRLPLIDVYDAVTWSSISPLSQLSIKNGNASVEVPDFKGSR
jgi:predicted dehydrogenase